MKTSSEEFVRLSPSNSDSRLITKVERYGWKVIDEPGTLAYVDKTQLVVDHSYQRNYIPKKSIDLARGFSYFFCGVIICADRGDGKLYVVDGQHRYNAAMKRADIQTLPVIIFKTVSLSEEANAFVGANTFRKNVKSLDKYKALIVAGDQDTLWLKEQLNFFGIKVVDHATKPLRIKSIATCKRMMHENKEDFVKTLDMISVLCSDDPIRERVLLGMFYIVRHLDTPISDKRLRAILLKIGAKKLERAATQAASYYAKGGSKIYAQGMIEECNRGLKNRFSFKE